MWSMWKYIEIGFGNGAEINEQYNFNSIFFFQMALPDLKLLPWKPRHVKHTKEDARSDLLFAFYFFYNACMLYPSVTTIQS